jgi:hypothetical protein
MAGGSNGYRAALVRRQHTLVLISSLPGTAGLPPFISFSTSYGELDSAVRRPMLRIGKRREDYFAVAQAALLEAKHRKSRNLSPIVKKVVRRAELFKGHLMVSGFSVLLIEATDNPRPVHKLCHQTQHPK